MKKIMLTLSFVCGAFALFAEIPQGKTFDKRYFEVGEFKEVHNPAWGVTEDPWCINDHTFVYDKKNKKWHVYGITHSREMNYIVDPGITLLHISADSLFQTPWDIQPHALVADKKYRESVLWAPHCIFHKGKYYMYACGGGQEALHQHDAYQLNLYISEDAHNWSRYKKNPLFTDGFDARDPVIIRDGDQWIMYYTANSQPLHGNHIIAAYTSTDLLNWSNRTVVFTHPREGSFGGPTESPFVVRRGDSYYFFLCDGGHTDVYLTKNPFSFTHDDMIAEIHDCRASEIVMDTDGNYFISSAGWFGGSYGLKIAPLKWLDGLDNQSTSMKF